MESDGIGFRWQPVGLSLKLWSWNNVHSCYLHWRNPPLSLWLHEWTPFHQHSYRTEQSIFSSYWILITLSSRTWGNFVLVCSQTLMPHTHETVTGVSKMYTEIVVALNSTCYCGWEYIRWRGHLYRSLVNFTWQMYQVHGRLASWRKWKSCDIGEAKEGLENELWCRWSDGTVGEWAVS